MGDLHHFTDILAVMFTESRADIHGMSMVTDLFSLLGRGTRRAIQAAFGCSLRTAKVLRKMRRPVRTRGSAGTRWCR
jgi:hypothetical protein